MVSKRLGIFGLVSTAAVISGIMASVSLVGCGGSASVGGSLPIVHTTGGFQTGAGTSTTGVTQSSAPQQVQVTLADGTTPTVTIPANGVIPAGSSVTVLTPGVPILNGLTLGPKARKEKGAPTTSNGVQGEIDVDGCDTGLTVTAQGDLSGYLALCPGPNDVAQGFGYHTITAVGPFTVTDGASGASLDISGNVTFQVIIINEQILGQTFFIASVPTGIDAQLPSDGGYLDGGNHVTCTYPSYFGVFGGSAYLQISSSAWSISQNHPISSRASVEFQAFSNAHQVPANPGGGITSFDFAYPKVSTDVAKAVKSVK